MKKISVILLIMMCVISFCAPVSFADVTPNPNVTIVNPTDETVLYSSNLLISVKVAQKATITVDVFKESITASDTATMQEEKKDTSTVSSTEKKDKTTDKKVYTYTSIMDTETFVSESDLSFYTKKIENVELGTYKIVVNTLDADGKVAFSSERFVKVEEKPAEASQSIIFSTNQSGTLTFLKNLLTTIFGN